MKHCKMAGVEAEWRTSDQADAVPLMNPTWETWESSNQTDGRQRKWMTNDQSPEILAGSCESGDADGRRHK